MPNVDVPNNPDKVLERLPSKEKSENIAQNLDSVLINKLEVRRYGDTTRAKRPSGKKVPLAGTSLAESQSDSESDLVEDDQLQLADWTHQNSDGNVEEDLDEDDVDELPDPEMRGDTDEPTNRVTLGAHVVAQCEGEWFLGEKCKNQSGVAKGYTRISFMKIKGSNLFAWDNEDLLDTLNEDILM